MEEMKISAADAKRLKNLAEESGRTDEEVLSFVLRDGMDYCEEDLRISKQSLAEGDAGFVMPRSAVSKMAEMITVNVPSKKAA